MLAQHCWVYLINYFTTFCDPECYKFFFNFRIPSIAKIGLKWYAIPSVAGMMLEVGGLQFPAAPFNGWYNSIEIVRDLVEDPKYGLLQVLSFL